MKPSWLLAVLLACGSAAHALPGFAEFRSAHKVSDPVLLDRHGEPLQSLRLDKNRRALPWVPLAQMSPALLQALLLSEDRRFYEHSGVDWSAVAASAWGNLWNERTRGASTLTMQLAGLMDADLARPATGRSATQKLGQAFSAKRLEARWSKAQILEAYLNSAPFRGELVGIAALSQTLFGKRPGGLDAQEGAIAASLLRAPNAKPAVVAQRACAVLKEQGLSCAGVEGQLTAALQRRAGMPLGEQLAPHYARQFLRADGPAAQPSSLDGRLQRLAVATLKRQLAELSGRNVEDGAVLVLDNASGAVLAWVGSSGGSLSTAPELDFVLARRQPGSTLKPFVYQLALEKRLITAASLLDDSPAQLSTGHGLYLPQNYDRSFRGWVSARAALGNSLNVPAVRLGAMLGADALFERLNSWGLALPESGGYYGDSLALGSPDVSLLALTNAYRALANGGRWGPVPGRPQRRVADAASAFIVSDMLADNSARALTFGLDSELATRGFAAVKTGTSKDLRDNWCVGFSERYTVGVWVGNAGGEPMHGVSGISGAAPVWQALMAYLHRELPSKAPAAPAGLLRQSVAFEPGGEPVRPEWFVRGTEQVRMRASAQQGAQQMAGIANPRDGAIYALDPDIPPAAQKIRFEGEPGVWMLDGKRLGRGARHSWAPWPGRHELKLLGSRGQVLHSIKFEVRGATLKTASTGAQR
ncbi:penicillin-binding protein 1C [Paucibacter sp. PLA-PC-4]|uniref:penicillin-binding protein 1C n=1 Tax=Paucibacter sp. PLA-PC-4 TaxID=2993655 RepID=UPI00224B6BB3|nr:penicillin-binding protein 1C [Paucibacter sp. PLA-PC-4]MCX2865671.1 penicillin-binding protein 1C [Paucibacter sp. PLA-PC-4]